VVDSGLKYCCRLYAKPADLDVEWKMLSSLPQAPDQPRGGVIFPVEGERWIACISTMGSDRLPADEAGFLPFFQTLSSNKLHEVLRSAEALSPMFRTGGTPSRMRHFEKLGNWPEGLVVLGDAVCALNPVYGQGITMAALGAVLLGEELGAGRERFAQRFQRKLARQCTDAWRLAVSSDLMWRTTRGTMLTGWKDTVRLRIVPALQALSTTVTTAAVHDPRVARAMMETMHLVRPLSSMARPSLLMRIGAALVSPARAAVERSSPGEETAS
jgi:2-polyprenyl-6-methoxyphenol hydroxylase-like FAD-dependent oxidoreductase